MNKKLIEVKNLNTSYEVKQSFIKAVSDVSLVIEEGRTLGILGEFKSGKSSLINSILLNKYKHTKIDAESILFDGVDITKLSNKELKKVRDKVMIISHKVENTLYLGNTVKYEFSKAFLRNKICRKEQLENKIISLLLNVGISNPLEILNTPIRELSLNKQLRLVIAKVAIIKPTLLIVDELTAYADTTIHAQILRLLMEIKVNNRLTMVFLSNDPRIINIVADNVLVMYCGQAIEYGKKEDICKDNDFKHPYTNDLLRTIPNLFDDVIKLNEIHGTMPKYDELPMGCIYANRCKKATVNCHNEVPKMMTVENHQVKCFHPMRGDVTND